MSTILQSSTPLASTELPGRPVRFIIDEYRDVDVNWYRDKYGKLEGEKRFFAENKCEQIVNKAGNLLMFGGASLIWQALIGAAPTYYSNANTNIYVGDGAPTQGTGTVAFTTGSATQINFSGSQTSASLLGNYIYAPEEQSHNTSGIQAYRIVGGTTGTGPWTISPSYSGQTGFTSASGNWFTVIGELANQTVLVASSNISHKSMDSTFPSNVTAAASYAISAATNASPIVITSAANTWSTGDFVSVSGIYGNTAANGIWQATVTNTTTFSLNGSTGNGAWTFGGLTTKNNILVLQATFGTSDANFTWTEWGIFNGTGPGTMLNRKVAYLGTKTSAASWAFKVAIGAQ